jgi:hypothetical protein
VLFRSLAIGPTDNIRLKKQVARCNDVYDLICKKYNSIRQIDIHANATGTTSKAFGCSTYYMREGAKQAAENVYRSLSNLTPWKDLGNIFNKTYYTLRKSSAYNFILEISFYDEAKQLKWMRENPFIIGQAILKGFYETFKIDDFSFSHSINVLYSHRLINKPTYWVEAENFNKSYFLKLINQAMDVITKEENHCFMSSIHDAATLKIINSPGYWINTDSYLYSQDYMKLFIKNLARYILLKD